MANEELERHLKELDTESPEAKAKRYGLDPGELNTLQSLLATMQREGGDAVRGLAARLVNTVAGAAGDPLHVTAKPPSEMKTRKAEQALGLAGVPSTPRHLRGEAAVEDRAESTAQTMVEDLHRKKSARELADDAKATTKKAANKAFEKKEDK